MTRSEWILLLFFTSLDLIRVSLDIRARLEETVAPFDVFNGCQMEIIKRYKNGIVIYVDLKYLS